MNVASIESKRLTLWSMTPAFLAASLNGDPLLTSPFAVPSEWRAEHSLIELRWSDLHTRPSLQRWLLRAIVLRDSQTMIGHIGFHTAPNPDYLQSICPGAVEFGYTIYPAYRRRGYASEAAQALLRWAHEEHGVTDFIASAAPENTPSVQLLGKLGFERVGGHIDDVDGYEDIYRLHMAGRS